ncbi:MAG: hypothetical protein Q7R49_01575 [Candidatus Daviesbacteria bacterium]|nr:hypothetical protein [Candidatus Daviesbacteria bacterium]
MSQELCKHYSQGRCTFSGEIKPSLRVLRTRTNSGIQVRTCGAILGDMKPSIVIGKQETCSEGPKRLLKEDYSDETPGTGFRIRLNAGMPFHRGR